MGELIRKMTTTSAVTTANIDTNTICFKDLLESKEKIFTQLLRPQDKKRFLSLANQIASDGKLISCTPASLVDSFIGIAYYDLDLVSGEAYIVADGNIAKLQLGYKGYRQLLFRAGWVINAHPVYNCDKFIYRIEGTNTISFLQPDFMARKEDDPDWVYENLMGIFVTSKNEFGNESFGLISQRVIEKLRLTSANQRGEPTGIWKDWYEEAAIAKAIKKFAKSLPISDRRVKQALLSDDLIGEVNSVNFEEQVAIEFVQTIDNLIAKAVKLGFEVTEPTEKNREFFLKATPLRDDVSFAALEELGFSSV